MKHISTLILLFLLLVCFGKQLFSQTYTHPTSGLSSTNVGNCMVNTCTGTYTDDGTGGGGKYKKNIYGTYRVFCPDAIGQCVEMTFNSFVVEGMVDPAGALPLDCYYDALFIGDGATQNSTLIGVSGVSSVTNAFCGTLSPFTVTAANSSGCLSLRFWSDNITQYAGWSATMSCVPCAGGPTGTENNDCVNATPLCSDVSLSSSANSTGPGLTSESCTGCTAGGETYSNWYTFTMTSGGTLALTIDPIINTEDYDFALYEAGSCGSLGTPVRCTYAANTGNTGMAASYTDVSEDVLGDAWVDTLHVSAGDVFYLMVNSWSPPTNGYTLDFTLTDGAAFDCSVILPVELIDYTANQVENTVLIEWVTATESENSNFVIEKSIDGINFQYMYTVQGNNYPSTYFLSDDSPTPGINYYRLIEIDINGDRTDHGIRACEFFKENSLLSFDIFDLSGRKLYTVPAINNNIESTLQSIDLIDGIYIYKLLYSNGAVISGKFIDTK